MPNFNDALPQPRAVHARGPSPDEVIAAFREFAAPHGVLIPADPVIGEVGRCDTTGRHGEDDAAYMLRVDNVPNGWIQNWQQSGDYIKWKWSDKTPHASRANRPNQQQANTEAKAKRAEARGPTWRGLWKRSTLIESALGWTLAADYLRKRGITIPLPADVLRFCNECFNAETKSKLPALVALVEREGVGPVAVHRIYLSKDGGKAAVAKVKMSLGPVDEGAVRLAPIGPNGEIAVAEGIETSLAFMQMTGQPCWSALTAGGIERLILPSHVRFVAIAYDNDEHGRGFQAAATAARRWRAEGKRVWFAKPPIGKDFNDALLARAKELAA